MRGFFCRSQEGTSRQTICGGIFRQDGSRAAYHSRGDRESIVNDRSDGGGRCRNRSRNAADSSGRSLFERGGSGESAANRAWKLRGTGGGFRRCHEKAKDGTNGARAGWVAQGDAAALLPLSNRGRQVPTRGLAPESGEHSTRSHLWKAMEQLAA